MKIVIDTETTGLSCTEDEILQLSIIDESGKTIYNSYFKPVRHTEWKDAMAVNKITPEMVADAPSFESELIKINNIMDNVDTIIGYNTLFDTGFLISSGIKMPYEATVIDIMKDFAPIFGDWDKDKNRYKYKSLSECAKYYNYEWNNDIAHDSLSDCRATLHCYNNIYKKEKEAV